MNPAGPQEHARAGALVWPEGLVKAVARRGQGGRGEHAGRNIAN